MRRIMGTAVCRIANGAKWITLGKEYPFRPDKATGFIQVKNDNGEWKSYQAFRFDIPQNHEKENSK